MRNVKPVPRPRCCECSGCGVTAEGTWSLSHRLPSDSATPQHVFVGVAIYHRALHCSFTTSEVLLNKQMPSWSC